MQIFQKRKYRVKDKTIKHLKFSKLNKNSLRKNVKLNFIGEGVAIKQCLSSCSPPFNVILNFKNLPHHLCCNNQGPSHDK